MRIAHITPPGSDYLIPDAADCPPGVEVANVLTRLSLPLANDLGRIVLRDLVYVDAVIAAERADFDGVFINTVADYGLELVRAVSNIPVAGAGESAIAEALASVSSY